MNMRPASFAPDPIALLEIDPTHRPQPRPPPYRPPASTVDAFWYVVRQHDADYLARWLARHPADRPHLFKLWKAKRC
jgi:hypothetical protein